VSEAVPRVGVIEIVISGGAGRGGGGRRRREAERRGARESGATRVCKTNQIVPRNSRVVTPA